VPPAYGSPHAGAPSGSGYSKIYSTYGAFAAVKADGSITAWGTPYAGGTGAPSGSGYTKIYLPPEPESPHAVIEPLVLRAAKAPPVE
jgi:hypothetical protein